MIDPDLGYWIGDASAIEDLPALAWELSGFAASRLKDPTWMRAMRKSPKPFYANVLSSDDSLLCREIITFARGPAMRAALYHYFYPETPDLSHIGIFASGYEPWSLFRRANRGTQIPHFDAGDPKHVKLFCYLTPVGEKDGPLEVWPANASAPLNTGKARIDEKALKGLPGVQVVGPFGTTALVDTSRCIHYGSRTRGGHRVALVIHYCTDAKRYSTLPGLPFADLNVVTL